MKKLDSIKIKNKNKKESENEQIDKNWKKSSPNYYRRYIFRGSGSYRKNHRDAYHIMTFGFLFLGILCLVGLIYRLVVSGGNDSIDINEFLSFLYITVHTLLVGIALLLILLYYYFTRYKNIHTRKYYIGSLGSGIVIINSLIIGIYGFIVYG